MYGPVPTSRLIGMCRGVGGAGAVRTIVRESYCKRNDTSTYIRMCACSSAMGGSLCSVQLFEYSRTSL